jgi:hypothetical protein
MQALTFNATDASYVNSFGAEGTLTLSQVGAVDPVTGKPYAGDPSVAAYAPPATSAIASTVGGTTILLSTSFYGENAADQAVTLVHELLHLTFGGESDADVAARFGIQYTVVPSGLAGVDDTAAAAGRAISNWLSHDCGGNQ